MMRLRCSMWSSCSVVPSGSSCSPLYRRICFRVKRCAGIGDLEIDKSGMKTVEKSRNTTRHEQRQRRTSQESLRRTGKSRNHKGVSVSTATIPPRAPPTGIPREGAPLRGLSASMERTSTESDRLRIGQAQLPTLRLRVSLRESLSWFRIYFIFTARALHRKCIVSIVVDYVHVVKN